MLCLISIIEWAEVCLGVMTLAVSLLQGLVVKSKVGQYCVLSSGILATEGSWIRAMVYC